MYSTSPIGLCSPLLDTLQLTFAPLHNTMLLLMGLLPVIQLLPWKVEFALPSVVSPSLVTFATECQTETGMVCSTLTRPWPLSHFAITPLGVSCWDGCVCCWCVCTLLHSVAGDLKHELSMHLPACKHTTKKKNVYCWFSALLSCLWLRRRCEKAKNVCTARRGEQCEMCVLSAGVLVPGLAAPVCSSQGDLWPTLLKLKVHPQFRGRFTQRSTGYSATRALSLFLTPCVPPSLAFFSLFFWL